jgi:RND family efflux transporter MFP subunit
MNSRLALWIVIVLALLHGFAAAQITGSAGPYRLSATTQPAVIPVGRARVILEVTDAQGKSLDGLEVRGIARMPGMFMGEREQSANPVPGQPGAYAMEAAFPMAGAYEIEFRISGHLGSETAILRASTGQNTAGASSGRFSVLSLLPWAILLAAAAFVVYRLKRTGQQVRWKSILNRGTVIGLLLLAGLLILSRYAVMNWRRDGAMTPIEAQVMEMNTPAPPGTTAVELAKVERGNVAETVTYTGQAVGFVEQDVNPRVSGVIVSMPHYVGDRVKKGQVLARLDTSQLDPQLAERAAMSAMAAEGVGVAAAEYQAALQEVAEARADVSVRESGVAEAEAMLEAARQDRRAAESEVAAMQGDVEAAQAEVAAAQEAAKFRTDELARMRTLFQQNAVSRSELQQAESEAAEAQSALRRARSMVEQAKARVAAAQANVRKADAMSNAAQRRVRQAQAEVAAAKAAVVSRQKAAEAAKKGVSKEQAAVAQARAGYQSAAAQRGYAELKAEVDGVITQRIVSPGTLVSLGQTVLKVAQISPIRLQANVPERDLARIEKGDPVSIVARNGKVPPIRARVTSISPAVDPRDRTGIVEVVWANAAGAFLPGQFVEMRIEVGEAQESLTVPPAALQRPPGGAKPFVWVAEAGGEPGRHSVRRVEVEVGASDGERVAVSGNLQPGQMVVAVGAANLREGAEVFAPSAESAAGDGPVVEVLAGEYRPPSVAIESGKPTTITFIRRSEVGCGTEVVFPDLGITKPLPLNEPVKVTLTPEKAGELRFTCGMDMFEGKVIVR